eukprot:TRINITY_DN2022_c0_g2_i1.p1 TRINITY_DN2022_c0_g2~~TRINITY_DN2022_c0_g2_i1.p1  ORF type:complete len:212 (+),score=43.17 TRINITY_DN2022_c0_g2_i1:77-712(+)
MSHRLVFLFSLCCLLQLAASKEKSHVTILNDANFDELVSHGDWLIDFFTPWCGHCQELAPIWEEIATVLAHETSSQDPLRGVIHVAKIDATINPSTARNQDIHYYPTIKFFSNGQQYTYDADRPRTLHNILSWVEQHLPPERKRVLPKHSEQNHGKIYGQVHFHFDLQETLALLKDSWVSHPFIFAACIYFVGFLNGLFSSLMCLFREKQD